MRLKSFFGMTIKPSESPDNTIHYSDHCIYMVSRLAFYLNTTKQVEVLHYFFLFLFIRYGKSQIVLQYLFTCC